MLELTPYRNGKMQVYDPFRELEALERSFFGGGAAQEFKTDIRDGGDSYTLEAELPGFKKEDIAIDLDDERLTIKAERKNESEEKDQKGNLIRCERSYGSFVRSFNVSGIDSAAVTAEYSDGVLKLAMPKKEDKEPKSRRLQIN